MTQSNGYGDASRRSKSLASALRDISTLVGEPQSAPVTLECQTTVAPGLGMVADAARLSSYATDIEQGIFKVLVMGEFKNGKSTLLNAILGEETLPAKAVPCTAVISVLVNGTSPDVCVFEVGKKEPRKISWEEFMEEFRLTEEDQETLMQQKYLDRFEHVNYVQIERSHPFCANGVRLIDSPGLGEAASRTKATMGYFNQTHAIIFVLNATKILSKEEKQFIETYLLPEAKARANNVFFVVNRINLVLSKEVPGIQEWVKKALRPMFTGSDGQLDENLYNRRVFYVNALAAQEAREMAPIDERMLEESGVLALERELERFLTGEEKVSAAFGSSVQAARHVVSQAQDTILQQKAALDQPLTELEERRAVAEKKLRELEKEKRDIERSIQMVAETAKSKVFADLSTYLNEMHETWPQDSGLEASSDAGTIGMINLDEIGAKMVVSAAMGSANAKAQIEAIVSEGVRDYLLTKFNDWSTRVPTVVAQDVEAMQEVVGDRVTAFEEKLQEIKIQFAAGEHADVSELFAHRSGQKKFMAGLAALLMDPSNFAGSLMGKGDWSGFVGRMVMQGVFFMIVGSVMSGGLLLVAFVLTEAYLIQTKLQEFKRNLLHALGEKLHQSLQQKLPELRQEIDTSVGEPFERFTAELTSALQSHIDEARAEQDRIIAQKKDQNFSVEQEKNRLGLIGAQLTQLLETVNAESGWSSAQPSVQVGSIYGATDEVAIQPA